MHPEDDLPHYVQLTGWIHRVPLTWMPGLLAACIDACVANRVFIEGEGGLQSFVKKAEARAIFGSTERRSPRTE